MNDQRTEIAISVRDLLGLGGPLAGSSLVIFASLVVGIAFFLPWISCSGFTLTAMELASSEVPADLSTTSSVFLYLLPLLASVAAFLAITTIALAIRRRMPRFLALLSSVGTLFTSALMTIPLIIFYLRVSSARSEPELLGLGALIQIEEGFWVTGVGILTAIAGAMIAVTASGFEFLYDRQNDESKVNGETA